MQHARDVCMRMYARALWSESKQGWPLYTSTPLPWQAARWAARGAAATLAVFIRETYPHGLPLVIGAMADKDTDGIMSALRPAATEFICTASETPRAVPPSELAARVRRLAGGIPVTEEANPWRAVTAAWRRHTTVCVTGSLFLVGQVLSTAESKGATRRHDAR